MTEKTFIFDLDQTLYPKSSNIIRQIDHKIAIICAEIYKTDLVKGQEIAYTLNDEYGTTLNGLVRSHKIDKDDYLTRVHDVDYSELIQCHALQKAIAHLSGRRYIYTNGTKDHAQRVLKKRYLQDYFDDIHDIKASNFIAKPSESAFKEFLYKFQISPEKAVFFDDNINNVKTAQNLGIEAYHVLEGEAEREGCSAIKNLAEFLELYF
ncbi:MAG: pyrimidine 5'-nucleotidase [Pseudomonadota bacterium]